MKAMARFKKPTKLGRRVIAIIVLLACVATGLIIWTTAFMAPNKPADITNSPPPFQALLPNNVAVQDLGGWQKLTPPSGQPAYVFVDSIEGTLITVSQQPLPESFKSNTEAQVAALAKSDNATDILEASGVKAYIGTNAKGPQSVYFAKSNLLVLIKSQATISDSNWANYISLLTVSDNN